MQTAFANSLPVQSRGFARRRRRSRPKRRRAGEGEIGTDGLRFSGTKLSKSRLVKSFNCWSFRSTDRWPTEPARLGWEFLPEPSAVLNLGLRLRDGTGAGAPAATRAKRPAGGALYTHNTCERCLLGGLYSTSVLLFIRSCPCNSAVAQSSFTYGQFPNPSPLASPCVRHPRKLPVAALRSVGSFQLFQWEGSSWRNIAEPASHSRKRGSSSQTLGHIGDFKGEDG